MIAQRVLPQDSPCYRKNSGLAITDGYGRFFLAERSDVPGAWQMPQGGIDDGESPLEAAYRELCEETCIRSEDLLLKGVHPEWLTYEWGDNRRKDMPEHVIGVAQIWFYFQFVGNESSIDLLGAQDVEFRDWRWASPIDVLNEAHSMRKGVYMRVMESAPHFID